MFILAMIFALASIGCGIGGIVLFCEWDWYYGFIPATFAVIFLGLYLFCRLYNKKVPKNTTIISENNEQNTTIKN